MSSDPSDRPGRVEELRGKLMGLPGQLVVISGPSAGAGKGKVIRDLLEIGGDDFWLSRSMTTRQIRADDKIHHTYTFVSLEEFDRREAAGEFLEANGVTVGSRYGTPLHPIIEHLAEGRIVLLEIDIRGARFVHEVLPDTPCIFIKPTDGDVEEDLAELRRRLEKRDADSEELMTRKLEQAVEELRTARELGFYDAWVVNATGRSHEAAQEIYDLIVAHRAKR